MSGDQRRWWRDRLGSWPDPGASCELGPAEPGPGWRQYPFRLTSFGTSMECALLRPRRGPAPGPAVVLPFYEVATLLGRRSARTRRRDDAAIAAQAYACHLVGRGVAVLAVPWWFEYVAPADAPADLHGRYGPAAARHPREHPGTGLGRAVGDLVAAVDGLTAVPWVDPTRIGVFGHSLGGKLALHLAAFDIRIAAAVAHEPGLGFAHSNWSDPWYLGSRVPAGHDQDEVLALVAPRPFLLVAGGDSDGDHNRGLVSRAQAAYAAAGAPDALQTLVHDNGHQPPAEVREACYDWLLDRLALP